MKLSEKQKEAIEALRKRGGYTTNKYGAYIPGIGIVRASLFNALIDKNLIAPTPDDYSIYELTDLGKTISI